MSDGLVVAREIESSLASDARSWKVLDSEFRILRRAYGNPGQAVTVSISGNIYHSDRTINPGWRGRRVIRRAIKKFFRDNPTNLKAVIAALHQKARYDY